MAVLVLLVAAGLPAVASAHANLEHADPLPGADLGRAPSAVRLTFSEAVDPNFSHIQVLDEHGQRVDANDSHVAPDDPQSLLVSVPSGLPDGVYTVAWRTVSAVDGHTVESSYPLIIGPMPAMGMTLPQPAPAAEPGVAPETAVGRWWFILAASLLFGTLLAWQVVFGPALAWVDPLVHARVARRTRGLALWAAVLLLEGTLFGAFAQAAVSAEVPIWTAFGRPLFQLLSGGHFAAVWWPRLALVAVVLGSVARYGVRGRPGRWALVAAGLVLLTSSLDSHAAAVPSGAYLAVGADWLHFVGVGAWFGGLATLVYVLPVAVEASQGSGQRVLARAVQRFSNVALAAVGLIVATGVFAAWLEVGSWQGLLQTAYGLSLSAKVLLLLGTLGFAAFNLLIARPGFVQGAGRRSVAAAVLARRFALAVRAELALIGGILLLTAVLTGLSPAPEELAQLAGAGQPAGAVDRRVTAAGTDVRIQVSPAVLGPNHLAVTLPADINPQGVERVQLTMTYLDQQMGSEPIVLQHSASDPHTWEVTSPALSQAGSWQAELLVRQTGKDDLTSALQFTVAAPGAMGSMGTMAMPMANPADVYPTLPSPPMAAAYLLVVFALIAAGTLGVAFLGGLHGAWDQRLRPVRAAVRSWRPEWPSADWPRRR